MTQPIIDHREETFGNVEYAWRANSELALESSNPPCLWMQAGAVEEKYCDNYYNCTDCEFDTDRRMAVEDNKQLSWQTAMRRREGMHRLCQHSLTKRIENRVCPNDYQCAHCDFDQYFEDVLTPKTRSTADRVHRVKGFEVPDGYYFAKGHTWAKIESGGMIRVGIDDFALKIFGAADRFDLPLMGHELHAGETAMTFIRGENRAEMRSPIDGVIVEVNSDLRKNPGIANTGPYSEGWLFTLHTRNIDQAFQSLMTGEECIAWTLDEVSILESMIEEKVGPLAADGGHIRTDVYGSLPSIGWKNLTRQFLGPD